jgi:hypothetical protein
MDGNWGHWNSGYFFRRNEDGSVEMAYHERANQESKLIAGTIFDANTWASIVAHVSTHGDNNPFWQQALDFHNGEEK